MRLEWSVNSSVVQVGPFIMGTGAEINSRQLKPFRVGVASSIPED